jgi:hypothetical protein
MLRWIFGNLTRLFDLPLVGIFVAVEAGQCPRLYAAKTLWLIEAPNRELFYHRNEQISPDGQVRRFIELREKDAMGNLNLRSRVLFNLCFLRGLEEIGDYSPGPHN